MQRGAKRHEKRSGTGERAKGRRGLTRIHFSQALAVSTVMHSL